MRLWDARSGRVKRVLRGHSGAVSCVAVNPHGSMMVSGIGAMIARGFGSELWSSGRW